MADGNPRGLDDEALRRLCLALAPLLACSLDLRSSGCEPRVPGETAARETPTERAIDAGQLAAARAAEARVIRCGRSTECLRWLAENGGPGALKKFTNNNKIFYCVFQSEEEVQNHPCFQAPLRF